MHTNNQSSVSEPTKKIMEKRIEHVMSLLVIFKKAFLCTYVKVFAASQNNLRGKKPTRSFNPYYTEWKSNVEKNSRKESHFSRNNVSEHVCISATQRLHLPSNEMLRNFSYFFSFPFSAGKSSVLLFFVKFLIQPLLLQFVFGYDSYRFYSSVCLWQTKGGY